jgi:hypothetical protein
LFETRKRILLVGTRYRSIEVQMWLLALATSDPEAAADSSVVAYGPSCPHPVKLEAIAGRQAEQQREPSDAHPRLWDGELGQIFTVSFNAARLTLALPSDSLTFLSHSSNYIMAYQKLR